VAEMLGGRQRPWNLPESSDRIGLSAAVMRLSPREAIAA